MQTSKGGAGFVTGRSWTFFTTHARVLLALARNPDLRVTELAEAVQLTERAAYRVLADLQQAGYVTRERVGRRNRYAVNKTLALEDPGVEASLVTDLLARAAIT
jgi:DNA-binding IclR family transcriptional regulator